MIDGQVISLCFIQRKKKSDCIWLTMPPSYWNRLCLFLASTAAELLKTGRLGCAVEPLQMVQNSTACLVCDQPNSTHVQLHWLPMAVQVKFKSLILADRVTVGSECSYLNSVSQAFVFSWPAYSFQECGLSYLSLRTRQSQCKPFSFVVPWCWKLQSVIWAGTSLSCFKNLLKPILKCLAWITNLVVLYWFYLYSFKNKNK